MEKEVSLCWELKGKEGEDLSIFFQGEGETFIDREVLYHRLKRVLETLENYQNMALVTCWIKTTLREFLEKQLKIVYRSTDTVMRICYDKGTLCSFQHSKDVQNKTGSDVFNTEYRHGIFTFQTDCISHRKCQQTFKQNRTLVRFLENVPIVKPSYLASLFSEMYELFYREPIDFSSFESTEKLMAMTVLLSIFHISSPMYEDTFRVSSGKITSDVIMNTVRECTPLGQVSSHTNYLEEQDRNFIQNYGRLVRYSMISKENPLLFLQEFSYQAYLEKIRSQRELTKKFRPNEKKPC